MLVLQLRMATADEITIPKAVLRNVEQRLAERGLRVSFGAIHCDPAGRVVVRDLKFFPSRHPGEPVLTMRALRFEINPYALWVRKIAPRPAARIDGASLRLPAMFSSAGINAAVIDNINAEVELKPSMLVIDGLSARAGNLSVLCRGSVSLAEARGARLRGADVLSDIITAYLKTARELDTWVARLDALDRPALDITLTADTARIASARVELFANGLVVPGAGAAGAANDNGGIGETAPPSNNAILSERRNYCGPLLASTTFALGDLNGGDEDGGRAGSAPAAAAAARLRIQFFTTDAVASHDGRGWRARNLRLSLTVPLQEALRAGRHAGKEKNTTLPPGSPAGLPSLGVSVQAAADFVETRNVRARAFMARIDGRFPKKLRVDAVAHVLGEPAALVVAGADVELGEAVASLGTRVSPRHIAALSRELDFDLGAILQPARPIGINATARLSPGWRLEWASGALDIGEIVAGGVHVERASGSFAYDHARREILFSPAMAAIGDSFARGSFLLNTGTLDFRFLLTGRLRPPLINGWFTEWWPAFWKRFTFDDGPPSADVDIRGSFRRGGGTRVFLFADAAACTYEKVAFDRVLLTLGARPGCFEALDLAAQRGSGWLRGTFTHHIAGTDGADLLTVLDFKAENIDPVAVAPAVSSELVEDLSSLRFEQPPERLDVAGRIDGPAAPGGRRTKLDITVDGGCPYTYDKVPFKSLSAGIRVRDDVIHIDRLDTHFAGGSLALKARISGTGEAARLGFDMDLKGASFGEATQLLEEMTARRRAAAALKKAPLAQPAQPAGIVAGGMRAPLVAQPAQPAQPAPAQPAGARISMRFSAEGLQDNETSFTGGGNAEITGAELVNVNLLGSLSQALRKVRGLNFTSLNLTAGRVNFALDRRRMIIREAILTGRTAHVKISGEYTVDTRFANLTAKVYPLSESKGIIGRGFGFLLVPATHLSELRLTGSLDAPRWRFSYGPTSFFRALAGKGSDTESLEKEQAKRDAKARPVPSVLAPRPAPAPQ